MADAPVSPLSILDRLLARNDGSLPDSRMTIPSRVDELRDHIRRDLEHLLNTRRYCHRIPQDLDQLRASMIGYGLPDIATAPLLGRGWEDRLCQEIALAIQTFEPRLRSVQVYLHKRDRTNDRRLQFRIDATMHLGTYREEIVFDTNIDPRTREIEVRP